MAKLIYNDLSTEFKQKVGWGIPLDRDEVVKFKLCFIPKIKQNGVLGDSFINHRVPNIDTVYDSFAKDEDGNKAPKHVQIALVARETGNENKPYDLGEVEFLRVNSAEIVISGKEPSKFPLLWYLRACNYNESNPLAVQPTGGYIFRELEPAKSARVKNKEREERNQCESYILGMKDAELISMLSALKIGNKGTRDENVETLLDFVQKKETRDKFLTQSVDVRTPIAALIGTAEEREIIKYEKGPKTWKFMTTGSVILQVPPQIEATEALIEYFHTNKHGKAFKEFLEKEVNANQANEELVDATNDLVKAEGEQVLVDSVKTEEAPVAKKKPFGRK